MICKNCKKIASSNCSGLCFKCRHIKNLELRGISKESCGCGYCSGMVK